MRDPYTSLGNELTSAAERQAGGRAAHGRVRSWFSHRLNATLVAAVLVLGGGAAALAATGVLDGSPVPPEFVASPVAGDGLPVAGSAGQTLAMTVPDPAGGLPWGMRILHTTRGLTCVQVGRVLNGQLGELGVDSAFHNDGRFHPLSPKVLPPGYGGASAEIECARSGETDVFEYTGADRSAMRLLPEEFAGPREGARRFPPLSDRRTLAYGLLGPHARDITYRTPTGLKTVLIHGHDGAFLIVEPAGYVNEPGDVGGSVGGEATASSVEVLTPNFKGRQTVITAVTFRFGHRICTAGTGGPAHPRCPVHQRPAPRRWFMPTRSLHQPVRLVLLPQSEAVCRREFLLDPCYVGRVSFTAPYAVREAGTDYLINGIANCKVGGKIETSWALERDVKAGERIQTNSLGEFIYAPSCAATERFQVLYQNQRGPSHESPHESVILGSVKLDQARLPNGAAVTTAAAPKQLQP